MNIKEAERLSGVTKRNIRFYEQKGLLRPSRNQENDYREYTVENVETLKRIRILRMVDMPVEQIKMVLEEEKSLPAAAAEHCAVLKMRIRQMETALRFCREFEGVEQLENWNVDEVLQRMEEAESQQGLPSRWTRDYRETLERGLLHLLLSLALPALGLIFGICVAGMWGWVHFLGYAMSAGYLLLWAMVGYWLYGQGSGGSAIWSVHSLTIVAWALYTYSRYISEADLPGVLEAVVWIGYLPQLFAFPFAELAREPFIKASMPLCFLIVSFGVGILAAKWKTGSGQWRNRRIVGKSEI